MKYPTDASNADRVPTARTITQHNPSASVKSSINKLSTSQSTSRDTSKNVTMATLPFIWKAMKFYEQKIKRLDKHPNDREDVIKSERKLQELRKLTPITVAMKLDMHHLVQLKLGWDDTIPDNLQSIWNSHFESTKEIRNLRYSRCVIQVDTSISTLDFADASKMMAAVAVYAGALLNNGKYLTQLIFARSKLICATTQLRGEMEAAVLNTHTGQVVKRALQERHTGWTKITDSQIVLHWISNDNITLKSFTCNRVIEVQRFTNPQDWVYINTKQMMADIVTRKGAIRSKISTQCRTGSTVKTGCTQKYFRFVKLLLLILT